MNDNKPAIGRKEVGRAIKIARNLKKMSQKQLAEACNMSQPEVSGIENGYERISGKKYKTVCTYLEVFSYDIFWRPESDKDHLD